MADHPFGYVAKPKTNSDGKQGHHIITQSDWDCSFDAGVKSFTSGPVQALWT